MLKWQLAATAVAALVAALIAGQHAAASAAAGGAVSIVAGAAAAIAALRRAKSAGGVLAGALRAEVVRIGVALVLLWLVLSNYPQAAVGVLLATFVVTMLIFSMAFFVREY